VRDRPGADKTVKALRREPQHPQHLPSFVCGQAGPLEVFPFLVQRPQGKDEVIMRLSAWAIRERKLKEFNRNNQIVCSRRGKVSPRECYECWESMGYVEQSRYAHNRQLCRAKHAEEKAEGGG
jgi:hypothetical protein